MSILGKSVALAAIMASSLVMTGTYAAPLGGLVKSVNNVVDGVTGSVNDTVDSLTGGGSSGLDVDVGSTSSDPNNILDVNIGGGGGTTASATVRGGNGQDGLLNSGGLLGTGLLDGDDDGGLLGSGILGSNLTAGLNLGGLQLDLTVPGISDLLGGGGTGGTGGGNGGTGGNGGSAGVRVSSLGDFTVKCTVDQGRQALALASKAKLSNRTVADWQRASGVQIVKVQLCPSARMQVTQIFNASGKIQLLHRAVSQDMLIMASLQRAGRDAGDVFAVQRKGSQLLVYVL